LITEETILQEQNAEQLSLGNNSLNNNTNNSTSGFKFKKISNLFKDKGKVILIIIIVIVVAIVGLVSYFLYKKKRKNKFY
jgi:hypothetical protein